MVVVAVVVVVVVVLAAAAAAAAVLVVVVVVAVVVRRGQLNRVLRFSVATWVVAMNTLERAKTCKNIHCHPASHRPRTTRTGPMVCTSATWRLGLGQIFKKS